jgi:hypothetical protein
MMGPIRPVVAACLVCGMLLAFTARAESGRITFSGAVVVPTCAIPVAAAAETSGSVLAHRFSACGGRPQAASGHDDAPAYALSVAHLNDAATTGSPLLQYFAGYLAPSHAADAEVVTRTYE